MNREEAWALLNEYNKDPFHLEHGEIVGKTMRYFAEKLGYGDEADFWEVVGILHDLDFEQYPDQHCIKMQTARIFYKIRAVCILIYAGNLQSMFHLILVHNHETTDQELILIDGFFHG